METVTSAVRLRFRRRKREAAASCVRFEYARPPGPSACGAQPFASMSELVVAPAQPKFTSSSR
jgi:hypothetical protein